MKLPFFSRKKNVDKRLQSEIRIAVFLSDWCPACLEYKVVLNKILSSTPIKVDFMPPGKFNITTIPSTIFIKGKLKKRRDGFMSHEQFLHEYNEFYERL